MGTFGNKMRRGGVSMVLPELSMFTSRVVYVRQSVSKVDSSIMIESVRQCMEYHKNVRGVVSVEIHVTPSILIAGKSTIQSMCTRHDQPSSKTWHDFSGLFGCNN